MKEEQIKQLVQLMKTKGILFADGLTDAEISAIENTFDVLFPPDLSVFLQTEMPVSEGFVNWRTGLTSAQENKLIMDKLAAPLDGILFDIQNNGFWYDAWGYRPTSFVQQKNIAEEHFRKSPKLIPIYSHRYIPSLPHETGNPIFSIWQTDIIYYGFDLATYFQKEFALPETFKSPEKPKYIAFWSDMIH